MIDNQREEQKPKGGYPKIAAPFNGEGGIRTRGTPRCTPAYQAGTINHSDTSAVTFVREMTAERPQRNFTIEYAESRDGIV